MTRFQARTRHLLHPFGCEKHAEKKRTLFDDLPKAAASYPKLASSLCA